MKETVEQRLDALGTVEMFRPNAAKAFEDRFRVKSDQYVANNYSVDDATVRKQRTDGSGVISPVSQQGQPVPPRRWIVEGLIPAGNVTMLAGDGGLGKSLLALQLLTCTAIGKPWLGFGTLACPCLGVFCEDDLDELHRRQADINAHYECAFSDLASCTWMPRVGENNLLMTFGKDGPGQTTSFYGEVLRQVEALKARLVALDSLHDLFGGDENRRAEARQFIAALRTLVLRYDGAVLLLCHPSLSGMNTGTGTAGSTAWNNAVRSRLYLTRPTPSKRTDQAQSQEDEGDANERVLKTMKANYSGLGGKVRLLWQDGVFVRQDE
jgi:RecA-family ATPase